MRYTLLIGIVCGLLAWSNHGVAQEAKPPAAEKPAGLRVMFNGNSWFIFVPWGVADQVKAAGIERHKEVRLPKPGDFSPIESGDVDVYAHGVHWWMEVPWGKDGVTAEKLVETGLKANPNFRAYYHAAWLVHDGRGDAIKTTADYDDSKLADLQAALDKTRKPVEAIVDKLNGKFGKKVVFLVPVGDATVKLREMVLDGKYPGVKKQSELWSDAMPHAGPHVSALSGYCHFAAIYRTSPVGLKISRWKDLTDEQHAILQKLAWDMVSKYPYAGIANFEAPLSPKEGEKAAPKPGAANVADALKGWKETQDLPAETVVEDYNDYIEKLPKAERPGVSNVKYYVDGNGQSGVAVLVFAERVEWTHFLTYDKQNKRTGATKFGAK